MRIAVGLACLSLMIAGTAEAQPKVGKLLPSSAIIFEARPPGGAVDELFAADIDGKNVTQLTFSGVGHNHFSVSPDRTMILTNRYVKGDTTGDGQLLSDDFEELWIIDLAHGIERALLPGVSAGFGGLAWSPDSRTVYFSAYDDPAKGQAGGTDIFRMSASGGQPENVTAGMYKLMGEASAMKFVSDTDVSPDGQWIAMVYVPASLFGPTKIKTRIAVMRTDGSAAHLVSDGGPLPPGRRGRWPAGDFDPDFSPDGKAVAFMRVTDKGMAIPSLSSADLIIQNTDGSGLKDLSPAGNQDAHGIPSWGDCGVLHTVWEKGGKRVYPEYHKADGATVAIQLPMTKASHTQWIPGAKCEGRAPG